MGQVSNNEAEMSKILKVGLCATTTRHLRILRIERGRSFFYYKTMENSPHVNVIKYETFGMKQFRFRTVEMRGQVNKHLKLECSQSVVMASISLILQNGEKSR